MNKPLLKLVFLALLTLSSTTSNAKTITTLDVVKSSVSSRQCLDYCIIGICYWLKCGLSGCSVVTTPKIKHNLPDLVVSSYLEPGKTPWLEIQKTKGVVASTILKSLMGESSGASSARSHNKGAGSSLRFNETNVIGSPIPNMLRSTAIGSRWLCKSQVKPFKDYFMSEKDALAWRSSEVEALRPESLTLGRREIGKWGAVFPRTGFVVQGEPSKAAAVSAQRAIDIVTTPGQRPHVYTPFGWKGYRQFWVGDESARSNQVCTMSGGAWVDQCYEGENNSWCHKFCAKQRLVQWMPSSNEKNDLWQMITPKKSNRCESFGASGEWARGKTAEDGNYAWNYWRKYKCCVPGPGSYLGSHSIPKICF